MALVTLSVQVLLPIAILGFLIFSICVVLGEDVRAYEAVGVKKRSISVGGVSLVQFIIGAIMIGCGIAYKGDCNNGATEYLITGGTIILSANIVPIVFSISVNLALCDNHISRTESFFLRILLFVKDIMPLAGIIVTIWVLLNKINPSIFQFQLKGSVIVFGAYRSWSAELELTDEDYCARPPFLCAFVLLILQ